MDIAVQEIIQQRSGANKPEWQIFYIDEEDDHRVYLISKEYMAPPTIGTEMTKGNYSYTYYWNDKVLNKYKTNLPTITETAPLGKFMNDYLNDYAGESASGQENLQATNYMLDQTMWAEYNGAKADLAFGGPTLPLFKASYNDISRTANKLDIQKSEKGYQVKKGTGDFSYTAGSLGDANTQKGIYFKGARGDPAYGMWLASPSYSETATRYVVLASYYGNVTYDHYNSTSIGFRPVVSLQSNVQFTSNADGSYTIN